MFAVVNRESVGVCALVILDPCVEKLYARNECTDMNCKGKPAAPLGSVLIALACVRQERSVNTMGERITRDI